MIEKYFKPGIRLVWMKPNDGPASMEGKVVDSRQTATPMTYDGLDGELINPLFMQVNVNEFGFTKGMTIDYDWLDYAPGSTAKKPLGTKDILTGYMSGCIITKFTMGTTDYWGHVGTIDSLPDVSKKVRENFGKVMGPGTVGYDPFGVWSNNEIEQVRSKFKSRPKASIMALITTTGDVHSILVLAIPKTVDVIDPNKVIAIKQDNCCVGGVKPVPQMPAAALQAKMKP